MLAINLINYYLFFYINLLLDLFIFILLLLPIFWYQSSPVFLGGSLLLYSIILTLKLNYTFNIS